VKGFCGLAGVAMDSHGEHHRATPASSAADGICASTTIPTTVALAE
jgi:hypothetical protein